MSQDLSVTNNARPQCLFEMHEVGEVTVIRMTRPVHILGSVGDTDEAVCELRDRLIWLAEGMGRKHFLINFEQARMVASVLLGAIFRGLRSVRENNGQIVLCGNNDLREILTVIGCLRIWRYFPTEEEGLRSFAS